MGDVIRRLLATLPLLGAVLGCTVDGLPREHVGAVRIWVLAGQSNMQGTATPEDIDRAAHPHVWAFDGKRWQPAADPLPNAGGVGPGLTFGKMLADETGDVVGLVQCSRGGTSILAWDRGGELYSTCLARARAAARSGEIAGVLWFQGESDVRDPKKAPEAQAHEDWPDRFAALVGNLRDDLGSPDLPVIFAQLGPPYPEAGIVEHWPNFQRRQAQIRLPHVAMIRTNDLTMQPDDLHFDAASYREIGRRFARAVLEMR